MSEWITGCPCVPCVKAQAEFKKKCERLRVQQQIHAEENLQRFAAARATIDAARGIDIFERGVCDHSLYAHPKYTKCKNWLSLRDWCYAQFGIMLPTREILKATENLSSPLYGGVRTARGVEAVKEQAASKFSVKTSYVDALGNDLPPIPERTGGKTVQYYNYEPVPVMGFCDNGPVHHEQGPGCKNWRKAIYKTGTLEEHKSEPVVGARTLSGIAAIMQDDHQKNLREYRASMGNPIPKPAPTMCGDDLNTFHVDTTAAEQRVLNDIVNAQVDDAVNGYPYPTALSRYGWEPLPEQFKFSVGVQPPAPTLFGQTYNQIVQTGRNAANREIGAELTEYAKNGDKGAPLPMLHVNTYVGAAFAKTQKRARRQAIFEVLFKLNAMGEYGLSAKLRRIFEL